MILPASEIARCIGIQSNDNTPITQLLIDSRNLTFPDETLFFALRTAGNDGHKYIPELISQGVRFFIVSNDYKGAEGSDATFWHVDSVLAALQAIAKHVRDLYKTLPVVGIAGSKGKTIVKEMLYATLCRSMNVVRSPRSYNSQIGVPLSIWELQPDTQLAIFEAGISEVGEMERLREIIQPTIGIFTSLTDEHSSGFSDIAQKAYEKALLFKYTNDIFYLDNNPLIAKALHQACPNSRLHAVPTDTGSSLAPNIEPWNAELKQLTLAVALFIRNAEDIKSVTIEANKISPRIDVRETLKNCLIIYDGFSDDLRSILDVLNYANRCPIDDRSITLILNYPSPSGKPLSDTEIDWIKRLLVAKNVKRLIVIGGKFPEGTFDHTGISMQQSESVDDFLAEFSISDFNDEAIIVKGQSANGFEDIMNHLEAPRHETIMEVDLGAIAKNYNYFKSLLPSSTGIVCMVKAAGYGVGALQISKTLQSQGASYLAVAVIDEGVELRRGGITMPIIVMNPISTNYSALFQYKLEPSVFSIRELQLLIANAKRLGIKDYPVHIKLDTGMHRLGFLKSELPELISILKSQSYVKVSTIFSHLATADCLDENDYTAQQLDDFKSMSQEIIDGLQYPIKRHILNTAGMMRYPEHNYDFARLGIGLYGISPIESDKENLSTVAQLFTTIISIKTWDAGTTIGYGRKGKISKPTVIATIPIGYADGLDRHLSNGGANFLVNGKWCPVVGNICMDQCMIDITEANAQIGDKVEIFGQNAPIERLSQALQTIPYEILTSISPRVKRIYFRE